MKTSQTSEVFETSEVCAPIFMGHHAPSRGKMPRDKIALYFNQLHQNQFLTWGRMPHDHPKFLSRGFALNPR